LFTVVDAAREIVADGFRQSRDFSITSAHIFLWRLPRAPGGRRGAGRGVQDRFFSRRQIYCNATHCVKGKNAGSSDAGVVWPETAPGWLRGAVPFQLTLALSPGRGNGEGQQS
jgi:hypothetical protein